MVPWFFSTRKTFSHGMHPFFCCVRVCLESFPPRTNQAVPLIGFCFVHILRSNSANTFVRSSAQLGSAVRCENSACKPLLCLRYHWCRSFFCVFGLLVALNIMSGDLKLCRECVIVEFL